jgi:hypothetical protein
VQECVKDLGEDTATEGGEDAGKRRPVGRSERRHPPDQVLQNVERRNEVGRVSIYQHCRAFLWG